MSIGRPSICPWLCCATELAEAEPISSWAGSRLSLSLSVSAFGLLEEKVMPDGKMEANVASILSNAALCAAETEKGEG